MDWWGVFAASELAGKLVRQCVVFGAEHQFGELGVARLEGLDQLAQSSLECASLSWSKAALSAVVTIGRPFLPTQARALRMKCARQRRIVAPSTLAAAAFRPLTDAFPVQVNTRSRADPTGSFLSHFVRSIFSGARSKNVELLKFGDAAEPI